MEELKVAVWFCGSDKALDGFNFDLIKRYWEGDLLKFVADFLGRDFLSSGCKSSFITLIPKTSGLIGVGDFRTISLIRVQYKIMAKVPTLHFASVVDSVVSSEQIAFINGRQIINGPLMANKLVNWFKKTKQTMMVLKIDFWKAFDSIS